MPSHRFRQSLRRPLAVGATAGLALGLAISSAYAGDDGAAPIWVGIGNVFGPYLGFDRNKDPAIDYRDRGRLVLPPKVVLPAPGATAGVGNADWPVDQDLLKDKKAKQEQKTRETTEHFSRFRQPMIPPGSQVTMTATAGQGEGDPPPCPKDAAPGSCSQSKQSTYGHPTLNFNPLTWVGLKKKDAIVLGPEPDRENLTDPPKGLRAPVEGAGAKIDNN